MTTPGGFATAFRRRLRTLRLVIVRSVEEFLRDRGPDLAGSLTFYGVLSLFPAVLVVISLLGVFGQGTRTVDAVMKMLSDIAPKEALDPIRGPIEALVTTPAAGTALVVGTAVSLWTASRYVRALGRTMNAIYGVEEGRPLWRLWPAGFLLTAALIALTVVGGLALVFTGPVAERVGGWIGLGNTALTVWEIAKWPAGIAAAVLALAILYRFAPNVSTRGFRWLSLGAGVALVIIGVATFGFNIFVSHFGNFNEVYGSLAGVIIFLLWLWLVNMAVVYGVRLDAEVMRVRQLMAGIPAAETLHLTPRDTAASVRRERKREKMLAQYRELRREPPAHGESDSPDPAAEEGPLAPDVANPMPPDDAEQTVTAVAGETSGADHPRR